MPHLLVVCTANQCRSPMAEHLIRSRLEQVGTPLPLTVNSAGTWAQIGAPATPGAQEAMRLVDIDIAAHRSQPLDRRLIEQADLILVMERGHAEAIRAESSDLGSKLRLFSSLGGGSWDVDDPIGGDLEDYLACRKELARLIDLGWGQVVEALQGSAA